MTHVHPASHNIVPPADRLKIAYDKRRVVNMFHTRCDDCKEIEREQLRGYPRYTYERR